MRLFVAALALLWLIASSADADKDGPGGAKGGVPSPANKREALRQELLETYRHKGDIVVAYDCFREDGVEDREPVPKMVVLLYAKPTKTFMHVYSLEAGEDEEGQEEEDEEEGEADVALFLTESRFVMYWSGEEGLTMVGRGMAFTRAARARANRALLRLPGAEQHPLRPLSPWKPGIGLGIELDEESGQKLSFSLSASSGSDAAPSWLDEETWAEFDRVAATAELVTLHAARRQLSIDRTTGLIWEDRVRWRDGKGVSTLRGREPGSDDVESIARHAEAAIKQGEGFPLNENGRRVSAMVRGTIFGGVLGRVAARVRNAKTMPSWLEPAVKRLVDTIFDDVLAEEELESVVAWGRGLQQDGDTKPGNEGEAAKSEGILKKVEDALVSHWWEWIETKLPAEALDAPYALPPKDDPLVQVFANAVRALASKRIAAVWVD